MNSEWAAFLASQRLTQHAEAADQCAKFFVGDLSRYGLIRVAGADAATFLQGQLTCDVSSLEQDRWAWAAHCSAKGRVLANFLLWRETGDFCMLLPHSMVAALEKRLRMFVLRSKVVLSPESDSRVAVGLGPNALAILQSGLGMSLDGPVGSTLHTGSGTVLKLSAGRALLLASPSQARQHWQLLSGSLRLAREDEWDRLCIENGEPWVLPATQEAFVPQMLNLELLGAVSFNKGCYTGQEIVARTQHLGQVKRRLYRYRCAHHAGVEPDASVFLADQTDEPVGTVVNTSPANDGTIEMLAVVQTSAHALPLYCPGPGGSALKVQPLPYSLPPDE